MPPGVGTAALRRALRLLGDDDPHGHIQHQAGAAQDRQQDKEHPDQGRVDVEVLGQAATHPGQLAVGRAAVQLAGWVHRGAFPEAWLHLADCSRRAYWLSRTRGTPPATGGSPGEFFELVDEARSRGSISARCWRIRSRSSGCLPYGLLLRAAILA